LARNLQTKNRITQLCGKVEGSYVVGYAFVFENIVVYAETFRETLRLLVGRKKFGVFLGAVKAVVPYDECFVLYEYLNSKKYRERKMERSVLKRMGLSRRKMRNLKRLGQTELQVR
jgi:hypothetical protein